MNVAMATAGRNGQPLIKGRPLVTELHPAQARIHETERIGLIIFCGSWAMMFGALFFSVALYRVRLVGWPPPGFNGPPVLLPSYATLAIVLSSLAMHTASLAAARAELVSYRRSMLITLALGLVFLALQFVVWHEVWATGVRLHTSGFAAFFYILTVFHALHVVVALVLGSWLLFGANRQNWDTVRSSRTRLVAIFWHFVDGAWLMTFTLLYVL